MLKHLFQIHQHYKRQKYFYFTKEFAIGEIKKNTRRFAKRQITWFKRDEKTLWFDYKSDIEKIINEVENSIENER